MKRTHIYVEGIVQGVYYRDNTELKDREYGLSGWVRNLSDGRVEIVCEGAEKDIQRLISWCQEGPSRAHVQKVDVEWEKSTGEFKSFTVRY